MHKSWSVRSLKPNHNCEQPSRVIYLDCETVPVESTKGIGYAEHKYRLSCTRYTRRDRGRWRVVEDRTWKCRQQQWDYIEYLCTTRGVMWVVCHNAVFDLTVSDFWSRLDGGEYILDGYINYHTGRVSDVDPAVAPWQGLLAIDDRKCIIECCTRKGRLNVVDSMNYYRCSLSQLGKSIGLAKTEMPGFDEPDEAWELYCRNDVMVLSRSVMGLLDRWADNDLGNWQPTAASLAWSNYRHKHLDSQITTHNDPVASGLERRSHVGGECRCFFVGDVLDDYAHSVWDWNGRLDNGRAKMKGPVYLYDVRSLYPYVMTNYPMPVRLIHSQKQATVATVEQAVKDGWCIADVTLTTDVAEYPYRKSQAGRASWQTRTTYPIGSFRTTLCGDELKLALRRGHVIGCGALAMYWTDTLFKSYVDYWYSRKLAADDGGDSIERELCKLMLNSLYGRFATGNKRWELSPTSECVEKWGSWTRWDVRKHTSVKFRGVGGNVLVETECEQGEHQLCAIASAITAAGRDHMRCIRRCLPPSSVLYQDTDSLLVTSAGKVHIESLCDTHLSSAGSMKLKGEYASCEIYGVKNYTCDGIHTIAGLPRQSKPLGNRTWDADTFESCSEIVSRTMPDSVLTTNVRMDFSRPPNPDMPKKDGWTIPVMVDDLS